MIDSIETIDFTIITSSSTTTTTTTATSTVTTLCKLSQGRNDLYFNY